MNAEVHIPVGLATAAGMSVVINQMKTDNLSTLAICLGCAVVGAVLPDIDANGESKAKKEFRKILVYLGIFSATLLGYSIKNGTLVSLFSSFIHSTQCIGGIAFLICCILGYFSGHRCFTHRLTGFIAFSMSFNYMIGDTRMALWFMWGFFSHQAIDMLNKRKIQWLYPISRVDFSLYLCYAESKLSTVIGYVSLGLFSLFMLISYNG